MLGANISRPRVFTDKQLPVLSDRKSANIFNLRGRTCILVQDDPVFGRMELKMSTSAYDAAHRLIDAPIAAIVPGEAAHFFAPRTFGLAHGLVSSDEEDPILQSTFGELVFAAAKAKLLSGRTPGSPLFPPEPFPNVDCIVHTCGNAFWPASLSNWMRHGGQTCPKCRGALYRAAND
jgi:hypothetical protein